MTFKVIPSAPQYEVSEMGAVRKKDGKRLKISSQKRGPTTAYKTVNLTDIQGKRVTRYVHSLVLEAWVGPRPPGMVARHLDDDGYNNWLENLCWGTQMDNVQDQARNGGLSTKGEYCQSKRHKMDGHNVIYSLKPNGKPRRQCRSCYNEWHRDSSTRQRAEEFLQSQGVSSSIANSVILAQWGRIFNAERDARAGADANKQKKGHITRELYAELQVRLAGECE